MELIQLKMSLKVGGLRGRLRFPLQCSKSCVPTFLSAAFPGTVGLLSIQKDYLPSTWASDTERELPAYLMHRDI